MSFIFGGNTGETQESVKRKREIANAIAARNLGRPPKNVGSGLNSIAQALMYRKMMGDADAGETAGRAKSAKAFGPLEAILAGGGASSGNQQSATAGYDQAVTTGGNGMQDIAPANPVRAALNRPGMQPQQPQIAPATGSKQIYDRVPQPGQQPAAQHNTLLPTEALAAAGMPPGQPQQPPQAPQQFAQAQQAPQQPQMPQQTPQAQQQPVPQDAMDNISLGQAYTAMNAEWLTPAQQSFAANVMKMKLQRMDPKYRMELMKIEQDIKAGKPEAKAALKNMMLEIEDTFAVRKEGRAEETAISAEDRQRQQIAQRNGFRDWNAYVAADGDVGVTRGAEERAWDRKIKERDEITKPAEEREADEIAKQNGFTGTATMSPAEEMAAAGGTVKSQKFRAEVKDADLARREAVQRKTRQASTAIDSLMRFEGKALSEGIAANPAIKALVKHFPGTDAYDATQLQNTIESAIVLGGMEEMRASSASGATGFGSMQKNELDLLKQRVASLNLEQSQEQLQENINAIFKHMTQTIHGPPPPGLSWDVIKAAQNRGIPADQLYMRHAEQNGIRLDPNQGWVK